MNAELSIWRMLSHPRIVNLKHTIHVRTAERSAVCPALCWCVLMCGVCVWCAHVCAQTKGYVWAISEYARGGNVYEVASAVRIYNENTVKSIAMQTLQALQYMHRVGVVHRDITPSNIVSVSEPCEVFGCEGVSARAP